MESDANARVLAIKASQRSAPAMPLNQKNPATTYLKTIPA